MVLEVQFFTDGNVMLLFSLVVKEVLRGRDERKEASKGREEGSFQGMRGRKLARDERKEASKGREWMEAFENMAIIAKK